jgi:hypothetical protein
MSEIFKKYMSKIEEINEANLDGTGPNGEGPKTGKGLGDCDSKNDKVEFSDEEDEEIEKEKKWNFEK